MRFGWLRPDLALAAASVTLFYCLFLFQGYQKLFRDSDAGWHIRTGEAILQTGTLPRTDPYSFTRAGQPWFAWEWGADAVVGAIHRAAGLTGVALFYGVAIAAGVWLWFRLHWSLGGNFLVACAMAPLLLSTCNIHWLARPHTISWLFLLAALVFAERGRVIGVRQLVGIAAFTALWANLHASFFLAAALTLVYVTLAPAPGPRPLAPIFIALTAPILNPYGYHLYTHVFRYLTDSELLSRIGEFQSFDFHAPGAGQILATVILGMVGGGLALAQGRIHHFVLAVLFTAMGLRSARGLPLVALVLLPLANLSITRWLETQGWTAEFLRYANRLRALDMRMNGLAWAPVVVMAAFALLRTPAIRRATGFPPDQFPVAAYAHIPEGARLFSPDKYGGYLIYRSAGTRKVFFDGRSDLYGAEFLKQYARLTQVRPGWRAIWDSYGFTHALLPKDYSLIPALEQIGWMVIYEDGTATLLARGGTSG